MINGISIVICGLGAAGRARLRALEGLSGVHLGGIVSRRAGVGNLAWTQALSDPSVDAVAVSTENSEHAARVREALNAGKHVLCDYPLALSGAEAGALYALARERRRVLHVEHIGLLASSHLKAKAKLRALGNLCEGEYEFSAGWNEKLADVSRNGPPAFWAVSRLMQLADWLGPFSITFHEIVHGSSQCRIRLVLSFKGGGSLSFTEKRMPGLKRSRTFKARLTQGDYEWRSGVEAEGLFGQDLACFRDRVLKGIPCYYDEGVMIDILDQLSRCL